MDVYVTNKTNKFWEIVCYHEGQAAVQEHTVSKIVSSVRRRAVQTEKCSVLCCRVIDACNTSNDV